jgi:hypothetical protein
MIMKTRRLNLISDYEDFTTEYDGDDFYIAYKDEDGKRVNLDSEVVAAIVQTMSDHKAALEAVQQKRDYGL